MSPSATSSSATSSSETPSSAPEPVELLAPRDGLPHVLTTSSEIAGAATALAAGTGPVAIDAERASGFRYSSRAYLIQIRREGSGTFLIDPIEGAALEPLAAAINGLEWVLHAADQDLPCLSDLGLAPATVFDTELAGRLLGVERVNLATMVERYLGLILAKGHGAADWSRRPLPEAWLVYAALDVEVLIQLRDAVADDLDAQNKTDWATQEFEHVRRKPAPAFNPERWRRLSHIHALRSPRQLAVARGLWRSRDELAVNLDVAPGRVLPDSAIVDAAKNDVHSRQQLLTIGAFAGPRQRRNSARWLAAIGQARALPDAELPPVNLPTTGPPPPNRWERRNPVAAKRLTAARAEVVAVGEEVGTPIENLLLPDLLRRLCWDELPDGEGVDEFLIRGGARPWQRELLSKRLEAALSDVSLDSPEPSEDSNSEDPRSEDSSS